MVNLELVHLARVAETQQRIVGIGDQHPGDEVFALDGGRRLAHAAAALGAVVRDRLRLGIAEMGDGDHAIFGRDQVFHGQIELAADDFRAARVAVVLANLFEFFAYDFEQAFGSVEDFDVFRDLAEQFLVVPHQLLVFETGEPVQAQVENCLGLFRREAVNRVVCSLLQSVHGIETVGAAGVGVGADAAEHFHDLGGYPGLREQFFLRLGRRRRSLDEFDDRVDVAERHGQAFQQMAAFPRLAQQMDGAAGDDLAPVAQESLKRAFQVEQLGLAVDKGDHVDAESRLQLGLGVQIVQHDFAHFVLAQFDDDAQAVLVGLVPQFGNAFEFLFLDEFGDAFDQPCLVDLVGDFGDDNGFLAAVIVPQYFGAGAHVDNAAAGAIGLHDSGPAVDDARGGKIRPADVFHQTVDVEFRVFQQRDSAIDDFFQVVRRNIGRHAHGDAGRAIDQQIGNARRQNVGDLFGIVVVGREVDGFLVEIGEQFLGDARHADLGVAHGRGQITVDRTEIALAVDQRITQGKILGHTDHGVINRAVPVGVVLADHVADDAGGLLVGFIVVVGQYAHGEQDAAMHGFQAVAHVGQRPAHDHAHGISEIGLPHFGF